jgi:shikimate 5-dehydrogenase
MYFIGVSTAQSSMMRIFPAWADFLNLGAVLQGIDLPLNAPPADYRAVVEHIKSQPLARGALVTTHKIDLLEAARDLFDELDTYATLCQEVSAIAKHGEKLFGAAKDPITSGLAWQAFIPPEHFSQSGGEVLCLGAGGAGVSISVYAAQLPPQQQPRAFTIVDVNPRRLAKIHSLHDQLETALDFRYVLNADAAHNAALLAALPAGSLVINATGMGKDRPGSPLPTEALFPMDAFVWELNYRGALDFLHQARAQAVARRLRVEDGWVYFLHGWTQVMAEIFGFNLTPAQFAELDRLAVALR